MNRPIVLSIQDPRRDQKHVGHGELNITRYATIDGRIFRVEKSYGSWGVEELETETSMVYFDEIVVASVRTLAGAREAIARHLEEWPTESREAHMIRLREQHRAWTRLHGATA